jgi:hypothetical protein
METANEILTISFQLAYLFQKYGKKRINVIENKSLQFFNNA